MKLRALLISASVLALSSYAQAADLAVAPVPVPSGGYDWSGSYAGLSIGFSRHNARYEDLDYDWYGSTHEYNSAGFQYGVQVGRNWQSGPVVYGIEADFSGFTNDRDIIFASDDLVNNQVNWMGSVRGRVGLGLDRTLIFFTGGIAFADFDRSWLEAGDPDDSWPDLGDTKIGVIGGIGVERALYGNWTVRAQALVAKFGDNTTINGDDFPMIIDDTIAMLQLGVNYRFGETTSASGGFAEGTPFDFSGFYAGGNLGGHMATISGSDTNYEDYGSTYDHVSGGINGGLQVGFNRQDGAHVYGIEAEIGLYGGSRDFTGDEGDTSWQTGLNWSGALKFKSGVAAGNTLMYVLGGIAVADYDDLLNNIGIGDVFDMGGTYFGYVAGVGVEQALSSNLSARLEATYSAFGGDDVFDGLGSGSGPLRGHAQLASVKAGVNYYFGDGSGLGDGALPPMVDWSGAFVGVDGIFAHHTGSRFDRVYYHDGGSYIVPSFGAGGGVYAGMNWQNDSFVYGVVADIAAYTNNEADTAPGDRQIESDLNWMGSLRGRAGIATGYSHIYATAGVAFADVDLTHEYLPAPDPDSFDLSGTRIGWTVGVGVEHRVTDRGSIKFETLFTQFGEESDLNGDTCSDELVTEPCEMLGYDSNVTVKVGYSHKFGG